MALEEVTVFPIESNVVIVLIIQIFTITAVFKKGSGMYKEVTGSFS